MRFEFGLEIARRPEDVFAYLADPTHLPDWQASAVEVRPETDGRWSEVRRFLGRRLDVEVEAVERDPPRLLTVRSTGGPFPFTVRHRLEPAREGTRLTVVGKAEAPRFVQLASRAAERQLRGDFERLKQILEGG